MKYLIKGDNDREQNYPRTTADGVDPTPEETANENDYDRQRQRPGNSRITGLFYVLN